MVERLREAIWDAAEYYAQFTHEPLWDADTLAVLMGSILIHENSYQEFWDRKVEDSQSNYGMFKDVSTGIANLRGRVVWEILNCQIPLGPKNPDGSEWALDMDFSTIGGDRYPEMETFTLVNQMRAHTLLQQEGASIDLLGANLVRGIRRAHHTGVTPSLFNVATWHNGGIVNGFGGKEVSYVIGVFQHLHDVADLLGARPPAREAQPSIPATLNIYNQANESGDDELGTLLDRVRSEPELVCRIGCILPEDSWAPLDPETICPELAQ